MAHHQPDGYLALPSAASEGGVLVLHAWWGLNATIRMFCDRLAQAGFTAFAPDLYHGKIAATIPEASALGKALDENYLQAKAETASAAQYLKDLAGRPDRGLAVIGFSLGAYYAVDLSASDPDVRSVVLFYGSGDSDLSTSRAAYLGHFAENDQYEPGEYRDQLEESLRSAGRPVTFHTYSGTSHWFFEPDRTEVYDPAASGLAWERTLAFLRRPLES